MAPRNAKLTQTKKPRSLPPEWHGYLPPVHQKYGYCKRCARRSTPCLKCGYCYLCHPFKEKEEQAEYNYQQKLVSEKIIS